MKQKRSRNKSTAEEVVEHAEAKVKKKKKADKMRVPTGSDLLDLVTGNGFPMGKIVNLVGDNSTGKTFLAIEAIGAAYHKYGNKLVYRYNDAESGFSFNTQDMLGFEIVTTKSRTMEEFQIDFNKQLENLEDNQFLIYVLDSLDGLSSVDELDHQEQKLKAIEKGNDSKGTFGLNKQKVLSEFFRTTSGKIEEKNCLLIIISQVRENVSGFAYGPKYKRMGGKALDFYASFIIWLSLVEKHAKKGRPTGVTIKAEAKKGKTERPYRSCLLEIVFDYGLDNIKSNLNFLYDLKTDTGKEKKKQKVEWDCEEMTVRELIAHIEDNDLEEELTERTKAKWEEIERQIASNRKKKY